MRCPKCDTKIKTDMSACPKCGTKTCDIANASYTKELQVLKNGTLIQKEKVFYTNKTPKEICRKKLVLLTVFFGIVGAHEFYVGKTKWAISKVVSFCLGNILTVLYGMGYAKNLYSIAGILLAYTFFTWAIDIFRVVLKKYPFPVMLEE